MKNYLRKLGFGIRSPHEWIIVFRLAFRNLKINKLRTALTVLGIVIGITAVIIVMAGGAALKNYVLGQVDIFGADWVQVEVKVPGVSETSAANITGRTTGLAITTLTLDDAEEVARLPNIEAWSAFNVDQELITYRGLNKRVIIFGTNPDYVKIDRQIQMEEGFFFNQSDEDSAAEVAVIGSGVRNSFFGAEDPVGKNVKIKGQSYRVVGLMRERGSAGFFNFDDAVYVPLKTMNNKLLGIDYLQSVIFRVSDVSRIEETALDARDVMREEHDITDPAKEDFSVTTAVQARDIITSVFGTINYLLLALTSISLLVGGVGIMNVMYVAVVERTREIGLRKAVGATNSAVLRQFLFEAVIVTLFGGIVGIILGIGATWLLNRILAGIGFQLAFSVPVSAIFVATAFSVATGIIFGIYPAWKASRLSPMEALRKE